MQTNIFIVNHPRSPQDKQVYMQSFCEAWMAQGGKAVEQSQWMRHRLVRHLFKMLALSPLPLRRKGKTFLVCSRGGHLLKSSLPYLFQGDIIPMLWDCWPSAWKRLERDLRLLHCKLCFITASDVGKEFARRLPGVKFVHIPEGVDITDYQAGKPLAERGIDVYELGQKHKYFHKKLMDGRLEDCCKFIYNPQNPDKGALMMFEDWSTFTQKVADSKIVISFPLCMRNTREDGGIDTLTMRFWEGMLSRCIIVGHCPQELMDLIGYNPVIEADFVDPCSQIRHILNHLEDYQELVNRNRAVALEHAPWEKRMPLIFQTIEECGG